ncbi:toll/interleukin-1 receptor domain-containing protein [Sinirhodobacter ferrireducens]|uniref:Toll/interleukin-1 receptor domain-containing protein n=1 Tax=Paenirhodobacter ferrireducens TaxID=1215032 RepID=A0A443LEJ4_9RHOB|nr:toll/interleukin-1 receptor domain-containing protein [Sinirhodobacter ferrireducens]RWR47594.1 toll/interleukin-1 receptor domain-containing protein [Sinirhodobacter ferrireducens]
MKVFISWSGTRSRAVATALKDWLPIILEGIEPWVSDKDISAGERWAQSVAGELEAANFGIICITPENLNADWILFESGALSKSMQDARVIPLLFDLDFSDISGPLAQFQAKNLKRTR